MWCLTRWDSPDAGEAAMNALQEADRLLGTSSVGGEVRGGVYFNLGQLAAAEGARHEANHYLGLARSYGLNVADLVDEGTTTDQPERSGVDRNNDVRLDAEPEEVLRNGKTQLMFWAAVGDEDYVRVLITRGVDLDAVDDDGDTALIYAVSKGHRDIAEILLRHGADPNICGDSGVPIRLAASRGWTEMVRMLAASGADVDARSTVMGTGEVTAVMFAAGGGYVDCLRALLELGANPELVDSDGDNALFYAQSNGKSDTADLLTRQTQEQALEMQAGQRVAEVDHETIRRQYSAIDQAAADQRAFQSMSLQTEFLASQGQWGLHSATTRDDVTAWLQAGAPINGVAKIDYDDSSRHWETPLLTAFVDGNVEAAAALIDLGADVDAPNGIVFSSGEVLNHTTLHMLAQRGDNIGAARLIAAGADVNRRTSFGTTCLHFAAGKDNYDLVVMLLRAGADPGVREFNKDAPNGLGDLPVEQAGPRTAPLLR